MYHKVQELGYFKISPFRMGQALLSQMNDAMFAAL